MRRGLLAGAGAIALGSTFLAGAWAAAQDAPESLLPPGFDDPAPAPAPPPAPRPAPTSAARPAPAPTSAPRPQGTPVVQPLPGGSRPAPSAPSAPAQTSGGPSAVSGLPSLAELESLETEELDALLGLRPRTDIPPAARRSLEQVGILSQAEGGLPANSLARQPASLVQAALAGTDGPLVSRWGHIMLRRALASRLTAPDGMNPVSFVALRARVLNRMGEHAAARRLVQDVDTEDWNSALAATAINAYVGTSDIVGICPLARYRGDIQEGERWQLLRAICASFAGESSRARRDIGRLRSSGDVPVIDALLAQRYAGAAGEGRSAVNLEWEDVEELTPWRFAMANALGAEIPSSLLSDAGPYYQRIAATMPMLGFDQRIAAADLAAREGILSSAAMVDLYSQFYADSGREGDIGEDALRLRVAYVNQNPARRIEAIRNLWGNPQGTPDYGRQVLTAYAAARIPADSDYEEQAADLIASMLAAGLDRDALQWASVVAEGSEGWALLALAQEQRVNPVDEGAVDAFIGDDESAGQRKSAFLVAGLAGLGRLEPDALNGFSEDLGLRFGRATKWSQAITQAGEAQNAVLVALLAGLGMQGDSWDKMTPRHLFYIVRALNQSGLSAEARMIAAEAVARG